MYNFIQDDLLVFWVYNLYLYIIFNCASYVFCDLK